MDASMDRSAIAEAVRQALHQDSRIVAVVDLAAARRVDVYVVGGFVRDVILHRQCADVDFVVKGAADFGREFSGQVRGTYVLLHEEHETARVVVKKHIYDFADPRGEPIAEDLLQRDFTLNAVAYGLRVSDSDAKVIVDPLHGLEDIQARLVRAASDRAMRDDPVRMVRAFRFAAELGFSIEERTTALIRRSAQELGDEAPERVHTELFKMLAASQAAPLVRQMDELGVLSVMLPEMAETKGVAQDERHHLDVWDHSLAAFEQVETILQHPNRYFPGHAREMASYLASSSIVPVLKLAALLHDVAKPVVKGEDDAGRVTFAGHSAAGAQMAGHIADRLRLSRRDRHCLIGLVQHHRRPMGLLDAAGRGELRRRAMARYFRTTGHHSIGLLLLALAHGKAMRGPGVAADWEAAMTELVRRLLDFYFDEYVPKQKLPRLLTGRDLLDEFSLSPGPELGEMLDALQDAHMADQVRTRDEALAFVRDRLRRQRQDKSGSA